MIQKFRAWHGDKMHTDKDCYFTFSNGHWSCYLIKEFGGSFCCDSNTEGVVLMQFTGILDKKGKEVYEGDVIEAEYAGSSNGKYINKVVWDISECGFSFANSPLWTWENIKVIGNIYQNPELIK